MSWDGIKREECFGDIVVVEVLRFCIFTLWQQGDDWYKKTEKKKHELISILRILVLILILFFIVN